jgi:hypothetical protein
MTNLNQVIEFSPMFYNRIVESTTVNGCIGTNFHIIA